MSSTSLEEEQIWSKYAQVYDPIKCGSIDGMENKIPHDKAIIRALNSKYKPNSKVKGKADNTIFIGRLHINTTEKTLKKIFKDFGKIKRCRVVRDIVTGASKCYGFIEYEKYSSAKKASIEMKSYVIDNCEVVVQFECERILKGWKPRRLGGGFSGHRNSGQLRFGGRARPFLRQDDIQVPKDNKKCYKKNKKR